MHRLILIGPPLSGKGTMAKMLASQKGYVHISTGDLFRQALAEKTPLGLQADDYMRQGLLVPDELTIALLQEYLQTADLATKPLVFDGFPRTLAQAEALSQIIEIDQVIYLKVPDDVLFNRLSGRLTCPNCGTPYHAATKPPRRSGLCDHCDSPLIVRSDDNSEAFARRLAVYKATADELLSYYRQLQLLTEMVVGLEATDNFKALVEHLNG